MTNEECRQIYERLIRLLQGLQLNWVAELAKQEITLGKFIKQPEEYRQLRNRPVRGLEETQQLPLPGMSEEYSLREEAGSGSSRRGQVSVMTIEYSEPEKLRILLNFIRQAVVDTTLLEDKVVSYFGDNETFSLETSMIRFIDGENDPSPHNLSFDNIESKGKHAYRLKDLINEILQEVDNAS